MPAPLETNEGENETARSAAFGGALRAWGSDTTAVFLNPANLALTPAYHLQGVVQLQPESARQAYGGIIMDSITNRLAGGIAVVGTFVDPDGIDRTTLDSRVALAYPLSDKFLVGLSGRYVRATQLGVGPFGDSKFSAGLRDGEGRHPFVSTFTFDAGITIRPTDTFLISVLGQNLTYPNNGVLPTTIGGGLGYSNKKFTIEVDGLADLNSWGTPTARVMAGAEYAIADVFPIRAGYRYDHGADLHSISLGVGYVSREFGIEASMRRGIDPLGPTTVVLGLAYFLESSGLVKSNNPAPMPGGGLQTAQ